MRVLLLTPIFPPNVGGAATYFDLLFQSMCSDPGVESVLVLAEKDPSSPAFSRMNGKGRVLRLLPRLGLVDNYMSLGGFNKALLLIRRSLALFFLLPVLTRALKVDIIHFHSTFVHIQGKRRNRLFELALRLSRGKKICDVRDRRGVPPSPEMADCFIAASLNIYE
jgi:glycosyltransferase involved in cell wall biosynthesis